MPFLVGKSRIVLGWCVWVLSNEPWLDPVDLAKFLQPTYLATFLKL